MDGIVFSFPWETELMIYIQSFATGFQTMVMSSVTLLGEEVQTLQHINELGE